LVLFHAANNEGFNEDSINENTINEILTSAEGRKGGRAEGRKGGRGE
jgi:hypothetical protein